VDASALTDKAPGRLIGTVQGRKAFVPNPLPPALTWDNALAATVSAADRALGQLAGLGHGMPNPHLLIRPFMRREAVLSSQIEGTRASLSDLFLFEVSDQVEKDVPDVREVANYVQALEYGLERVKAVPLSRRLICEIHGALMRGVRGGDQTPGEMRRIQVWIGPMGGIENATFIPSPPGPELDEAIAALEKYLHAPSDLPPVVRLALVHYQFEAIHPFQDGNGRVGRLLITLMLVLDGILPLPLLYLSAYFERNREAYYRHLLAVSQRGAWEEWITFFARGVASEAMDGVDRARRLRSLQSEYVGRVQEARASALLIKLVEELFNQPAVTVARVAGVLDVTPRTAQQHIDRLLKAGILTEITGQKRNRVFVADGIIRAIHEPRSGS